MVYRATTLRGLANSQMVVGAVMIVFGVACIISTLEFLRWFWRLGWPLGKFGLSVASACRAYKCE